MTSQFFKKCLLCYGDLKQGKKLYHPACCATFFGTNVAPVLDYKMSDIDDLAREEVNRRIAITGVQPKLSLDLASRKDTDPPRLTIVGLWGHFILKPPHQDYPLMPELEDLTMHLAERCGIQSAPHALIPFQSGELAYISRRFDRIRETKLPQEDFCQLTKTLTDDKYFSSMEKAGKVILRWATNPGFDATRFLELIIFSFLTGNSDMHLKSFSLLTTQTKTIQLAPAYDLIPSQLLIPSDQEESALPINGKKNNLARRDFVVLGRTLNIPEKAINNLLSKFKKEIPRALEILPKSYIPQDVRRQYTNLIGKRLQRLATV